MKRTRRRFTGARPRPRKPGGRRRTRAPRGPGGVRGLPWFAAEQWDRLLALAADPGELGTDYNAWLAKSEDAYAGLKSVGVNVKKVLVDVEELAEWCRDRRSPIDANSRPEFVTYLLSTGGAQVIG